MADKTLSSLLSTNPVTAAPTGDEPIETVVSGTSEAFKVRQLSNTPIVNKTDNYTLALTDQGAVVSVLSSAAKTVTIPLNATVAFAIGTTLLVRGLGTGAVDIAAAGGVTINKRASNSLVLLEQNAQVVLHKINTDIWHLAGELQAL